MDRWNGMRKCPGFCSIFCTFFRTHSLAWGFRLGNMFFGNLKLSLNVGETEICWPRMNVCALGSFVDRYPKSESSMTNRKDRLELNAINIRPAPSSRIPKKSCRYMPASMYNRIMKKIRTCMQSGISASPHVIK